METFYQGSVPVAFAAKIYGRDPAWVRAGIIAGWLPIGKATRNGKLITDLSEIGSRNGRISYYISPSKFYEDTHVVYQGKDEKNGYRCSC